MMRNLLLEFNYMDCWKRTLVTRLSYCLAENLRGLVFAGNFAFIAADDRKYFDRVKNELYKDDDIIEKAQSPWNSSILLAKKKDNSTRFVGDFREVNKLTKKNKYPLPNIQDVIDKVASSNVWSTLAAAAAYWAMTFRPEDRERRSLFSTKG